MNISKFVVVGDRVLVKPKSLEEQTKSGIYLPPGVQEKEKIRSGYVMKTGPGYAVAPPTAADEPWKEPVTTPQYIPLQARVGDLAIFLQSGAHEIDYDGERFLIVPNAAILLLVREDDELEYYLK